MTKVSTVSLIFADILDCPIRGLQIECRSGQLLRFSGSSNTSGEISFSAPLSDTIIVHVRNWITGEMKPVAKFFTGKEKIHLKVVSPKYKDTIRPLPRGEEGKYLRGTYVVKSNDTLSSIAKAYSVSTDYLVKINKLRNPNELAIGQVLKVPPVEARSTSPSPAAPEQRATPPHSSPPGSDPAQPQPPNGKPPEKRNDNGPDGKPTTTAPDNQPAVIFPFSVKPLNEAGGTFQNDWTLPAESNAACFGRQRSADRKHAGRDLYAHDLTDVYAIAPGKVLLVKDFYMKTSAISVHHKTSDGREFLVRYGEVDPSSITVKAGDQIDQGHKIAKTGILRKPDNSRLIVTQNKSVSMLHFELYTGSGGLDNATNLTEKSSTPYQRRSDLVDALPLLREGYMNTFRSGPDTIKKPDGNRISIEDLSLSKLGEIFIKAWEKLRLDHYNDKFGYCTVGWGHLVNGKVSCENLGIKVGKKITQEEADKYFERDKATPEQLVQLAIKVPLHQHEFDALVSLSFNIGDISKKAPSLCKKINLKQYEAAADEFLDITNGGVPGLVTRRKQENAMFLRANYDSTH